MAEPVQASARTVVTGGIRVGNVYFSSGITGVRPEAHKNPLLFGGDIKEQTRTILEKHRANLQAMGSSLQHVVEVTIYLADVKTEKSAMNEVYEQYVPTESPARSAIGAEFPDSVRAWKSI